MFVKGANGAEHVRCGVRGGRGCTTFSEGLVGRRVGKGKSFALGCEGGWALAWGVRGGCWFAGGLGELTRCQTLVVDI